MIRAASGKYPAMSLDFVLGHLAQVGRLVDSSARSRFVGRIAQESGDAALVPKLLAYANTNLLPADRRPIEQAVGRIRWKAENRARIRSEVTGWLKGH
jgi:hypothetical protein